MSPLFCPRRLRTPRPARRTVSPLVMHLLMGLLFLLLPAQASCQRGLSGEARHVVESFLKAWQRQDTRLMQELYPASEQMDFFYTSDEAHIASVVRASTSRQLRISVVSTFFGAHQEQVQRHITFVVDDSTPGACHIDDSFGLACWERYPYYTFACRTGCVTDPATLSDVTLAERMRCARRMLVAFSQALYEQLDREIRIAENTSTYNDGTRTEGVALIQNDSPYSLPRLRYSVIFYNDSQKEVGRVGGWITQETFSPGDVCAFCYEAEISPGATLMSLVPDFEVELIVDYVMGSEDYSGAEYENFRRRAEEQARSPEEGEKEI